MFTISIQLGNEAMSDGDDVAMQLRMIADKLEQGYTSGPIMDANGNTVGDFNLSAEVDS